jgi:hypothetical protein
MAREGVAMPGGGPGPHGIGYALAGSLLTETFTWRGRPSPWARRSSTPGSTP